MLSFAIQHLAAKKLRSALTIGGFGVCVNLYIVVTTVVRFIAEDLDLQVQRFTGRVLVQARSEAGLTGIEWPPLSSAVPVAVVDELLRSPRVDRARSSALSFAALAPPPFPTAPPEALVVGVERGREHSFLADAPALLGTSRFDEGAPEDQVILGALAARYFAPHASATTTISTPIGPLSLAAVGSQVPIRGRPFHVVGIIEPETNQLLRSCVVMPLPRYQAVLGQGGGDGATVNAALLMPRRASDTLPLRDEIEARFPALMAVTDRQLAENARKMLAHTNQLFSVVRWTAVTVAALLITIVMFVAVLERTKELGTLRAIGAPARSIMTLILSEALVIGAAGGLIGVPLSRFVIRKALGPDAVGIRRARVEWEAGALLTLCGLIAALLPATRAVRVDPLVALRYE